LERTRRGEAHLVAMSPAEFRVAIVATDRAGHLAAEGWVGRERAGRTGVLLDRVSFSVEVDPGGFRLLVTEFEGISSDQPRS
jgi:hypothetical protein